MSLVQEVLTGGVRGGTSILYAATGESTGERAGIVNLGTEGSMLTGALAGYAIASETGHPWFGVIAGVIAGALLAGVHAYFVIDRHTNQLATGLVVLFLGLGLTSLYGVSYVQALAPTFSSIDLPVLGDLPFIGPIFFDQDALVYLSYVLVPTMWWIVFRSRWGVILRACGERSEVLTTHGYSVRRVQYIAVMVGGGLAGLGGVHLSTAYTKAWFENMAQGRGFIAVAVVMFAALHPFKMAAGSYLFGAALALSPALQARGIGVNQFALDAVPYVVTLLVLVLLGRKRASQTPEGLSRVFETAPSG
jgi:general nucleoside transport system permease protein